MLWVALGCARKSGLAGLSTPYGRCHINFSYIDFLLSFSLGIWWLFLPVKDAKQSAWFPLTLASFSALQHSSNGQDTRPYNPSRSFQLCSVPVMPLSTLQSLCCTQLQVL